MRISLARALYINPQLLLLDEPTNHLDLNAVVWLTDYLSTKYHNTLIVVSHDKNFINNTCDIVVKFAKKKLMYVNGNYNKYLKLNQLTNIEAEKKWKEYGKKLKNINQNSKLSVADRTKQKQKLLLEYSDYSPAIEKR